MKKTSSTRVITGDWNRDAAELIMWAEGARKEIVNYCEALQLDTEDRHWFAGPCFDKPHPSKFMLPKDLSYYVASPYSRFDLDGSYISEESRLEEAYRSACRWGREFLRCGYDVFVPIVHGHAIDMVSPCDDMLPVDHNFWMKVDLPHLRRMDAVVVLCFPGFTKSCGVELEVAEALKLNKPVYFIYEDTVCTTADKAAANNHLYAMCWSRPSDNEFTDSELGVDELDKMLKDVVETGTGTVVVDSKTGKYKHVPLSDTRKPLQEIYQEALDEMKKDINRYRPKPVDFAAVTKVLKEELYKGEKTAPDPFVAVGKEKVLQEALAAVKARGGTYGDVTENFQRIADRWNLYLQEKYGMCVPELTPYDVGMLNLEQKKARLAETPDHWDSIVDVAGYAACLGAIVQEKE